MTLRALMAFERKRWSFSRNRNKKWIILIFAILWMGISLFLAAKGWSGKEMFKQPVFAWLALYGILFTAPGLGAVAMVREWKMDTANWWLALPAPREKLLLAKILVVLERWGRIYGITVLYVALYIVLLDAVNGMFSRELVFSQLQIGAAEILLAIAIGPFMLLMGLLMGSFSRSDSKLLVVLVWFVIIGFANIQMSLIGLGFAGEGEALHVVANLHWPAMLAEGIVTYGLAALIFKLIVNRLNQGKL